MFPFNKFFEIQLNFWRHKSFLTGNGSYDIIKIYESLIWLVCFRTMVSFDSSVLIMKHFR